MDHTTLAALITAGILDLDFIFEMMFMGDEEHPSQRVELTRGPWTMEDEPEANYKALFRFEKKDIIKLVRIFKLDTILKLNNGSRVAGDVALCVLLKRFTYPARLFDVATYFQMPLSTVSRILSYMVNYLHGLLEWTLEGPHLDTIAMDRFAKAIAAKGGCLPNCWGFLDGTVRPIARPSEAQKEVVICGLNDLYFELELIEVRPTTDTKDFMLLNFSLWSLQME